MTTWANLLANKTPPPEGEQLSLRCDYAGQEIYIRIRGKGWFYLRGDTWLHCPLGHPTATYPRDFVDPPER